jgi:hypothetical protein
MFRDFCFSVEASKTKARIQCPIYILMLNVYFHFSFLMLFSRLKVKIQTKFVFDLL